MKVEKLIAKLKQMKHIEDKTDQIQIYIEKIKIDADQEVSLKQWCELFRILKLPSHSDAEHKYDKDVVSDFLSAFKNQFIHEDANLSASRKSLLEHLHGDKKHALFNILSLLDEFNLITSYENLEAMKKENGKFLLIIESTLWKANELRDLLIATGENPNEFGKGLAQYYLDAVFQYIDKASDEKDIPMMFDMFHSMMMKAIVGSEVGELLSAVASSAGPYKSMASLGLSSVPEEKKHVKLPGTDVWMKMFATYKKGDAAAAENASHSKKSFNINK